MFRIHSTSWQRDLCVNTRLDSGSSVLVLLWFQLSLCHLVGGGLRACAPQAEEGGAAAHRSVSPRVRAERRQGEPGAGDARLASAAAAAVRGHAVTRRVCWESSDCWKSTMWRTHRFSRSANFFCTNISRGGVRHLLPSKCPLNFTQISPTDTHAIWMFRFPVVLRYRA